MKKSTPVKVATALGAAALLAVATPLAANAHVTVDPTSTAAPSYSVLTFSVGHGCEGSPTTALTFSVPESIQSVTPTVNPGWTIAQQGNQVVYSADQPLIDGQRTTFALSVKLPDLPAGEKLVFPVLQECEVGSTDWSEAQADGETEPEHPAPSLVLSEATADGHGHADAAAAGSDQPLAAGHSDSEALSASVEDPLARTLGIAGLALGAVGLIMGIASRRKEVGK
ncbi:YcnI family copper-binding membrane protein [Homoserinimonas sp. A520]